MNNMQNVITYCTTVMLLNTVVQTSHSSPTTNPVRDQTLT